MLAKLLRALIASAIALAPAAALAQAYPTKPVRLIVPFAPGGTNDILGRMVATHLGQTLGHTMIVDNRPGFQGILGTDLVAKAPPDGYTLGVISAAYTMNPAIFKLPYDTNTALEFVAKMGASYLILSVGSALPVKSVDELLAEAQRKPGELVFSTSGGFMHFASALFQSVTHRKFNIVIYKGGFPAMMDVMSGQAHLHLAVSVPAIPHLKSGRLKGLAVGLPRRSDLIPDIPTFEEAGVKGFDAANWYAIAAPRGTPRAIVAKLHKEIAAYFNSPETQKQMTNMGGVVDIKNADEMRKIIPAEVAKWTRVAAEAGMPRQNN
jgi:tripartite-type tricarboxylate transporter receptor subunit TctC